MRILVIGLVDYTRVTGGVIHQSALVRWMVEAGHEVTLLAPDTGDPTEALPVVRDCLVRTPTWGRSGRTSLLDSILQLPALIRAVRTAGVDVIYIRNNTLTPLLTLSGRVLGLPVVVEHNTWQALERAHFAHRGRGFIRLEGWLQALDARLASHSRAVTEGVRRLLLAAGAPECRLSVIGNGADTELFYPADRAESLARWGLDPDLLYLGFIGSLTPWHGVHSAISAMRHLAAEQPRARLLVFGDGPDRERLRALIRDEAVEDRVMLMGKVPLKDANAAINCFDIALAPFSRLLYEDVGVATIKLGDYAAAGRPVVGSDLPGLREMAQHGWIDLVSPDEPAALAAAAAALLSDPARRQARAAAARRAAEGPLNWREITRQVLKILTAVRP